MFLKVMGFKFIMSISPPHDLSEWPRLYFALETTLSSARTGKREPEGEDLDLARKFHDCLLVLGNPDINPIRYSDILSQGQSYSGIHSEIRYAHVSKKLRKYCKINGDDYDDLVGRLAETAESILEGKLVGDVGRFEDIALFLGKGPHPPYREDFD